MTRPLNEYYFEICQVDIAGWTDADGPLSILPLLDEDSDLEEEQYVDDDDEDGEDVNQAAARKKTKVSDPIPLVIIIVPDNKNIHIIFLILPNICHVYVNFVQ